MARTPVVKKAVPPSSEQEPMIRIAFKEEDLSSFIEELEAEHRIDHPVYHRLRLRLSEFQRKHSKNGESPRTRR